MKTRLTKLTAALLVFVMVFLMLPLGSVSVFAADVSYIEKMEDAEYLGKAYNMLGDKELKAASLNGSATVFKDTILDKVKATKVDVASGTDFSYTYVKDTKSYLESESYSNEWNISASSKFWLVSLEFNAKWGESNSSSSESSSSKEHVILKASKKKATYNLQLNNYNDAVLKDIWTNYVTDTFKQDVGDIGAGKTIAEFLNTYGTHILTSYTEGGEGGVVYSGKDLSFAFKTNVTANKEISGGLKIGELVDIDVAYQDKMEHNTESSESSTDISVQGFTYGAGESLKGSFTSGGFSEENVTKFEGSIDHLSADVMIDDSLQLMPIWELMIASGKDAIVEKGLALQAYFDEEIENKCKSVDPDFVSPEIKNEWTKFTDVKIITTPEEFNAIREDMEGIYVLASNIDLSGYEGWTPIGNAEEPFRGRLYGNYNTVKGLKVTEYNGIYAGLFGYNAGKICDLVVDGEISLTAGTDKFIGGVAAYNKGTIDNCYDNVTYDVEYEAISDLNLPLRVIDLDSTEAGTITIGDEVGVYLVGTAGKSYTGYNIVVEDSGVETPAYIMLENVNITGSSLNGTIYSDNDRPIYIISTGISNSITGAENAVALNMGKASVSLFGTAEITVNGGAGTDSNNTVANQTGVNGMIGKSAIVCDELSVRAESTLIAQGGHGGAGGNGADGVNGIDGQSNIGKKEIGTDGKDATDGNDGGNGGEGAYAIVVTDSINVYGALTLNGGRGGDGGNGGNGGRGGNGGNSGYWGAGNIFGTWWSGYDGGYGGNGSNGGDGGNGGKGHSGIADSNKINVLVAGNCIITAGNDGNGGNGGNGGAGGNGGDSGGTYAYEKAAGFYWMGNDSKVDESTGRTHAGGGGLGGQGGNGGNGGNGGDGAVAGTAGTAGEAGLAGYQTVTKSSESTVPVRTVSRIGIYGVDGIKGTNSTVNAFLEKITNINQSSWADNHIVIESVTKVDYYAGDSFDRSTIRVLMDGAPVADYEVGFNSFCASNVDEKITYAVISRDGYERYIPIHLEKVAPVSIEFVSVDKKQFVKSADTVFDISGLTVKVNYNNGDVSYVYAGDSALANTVPPIQNVGGTETVTLYYDHDADENTAPLSCTYEISVLKEAVLSIEIEEEPRLIYDQGDTLVTEGIKVLRIKNSGSEYVDYKDLIFLVSPSLCNVGTATVTVLDNLSGLKATYEVTVRAKEGFEHPWDEGKITTQPTHTEEGVKTFTCTVENCGATKTESVDKLEGHSFGSWYKLDDEKHERICECGEKVSRAHNWDSGVVSLEATHLTEGEMLYSCTDCSATKTAVIEKIEGHSFGEWSKCDENRHQRVCECGEIEYAIHSWNDGQVAKEPTYTEQGLMIYTCTVCKETSEEPIAALGIENAPQIVVDSTYAPVGKTVNVKISLKNNPGITAIRLYVSYDSSVLTLTDIQYNENLGGIPVLPPRNDDNNYETHTALTWGNGIENKYGDFVFATLTFEVAADAEVGSLTDILVTYDSDDIYDIQNTNINFCVVNGMLGLVEYLPGDINGDNKVGMKDATHLMQYLADWDVDVNVSALDVNGDGKLNNKDVTHLLQYLAGWDVELH